MRWKIFYGDGSTYSDRSGSPFDAPGEGAQVIVLADKDHGRLLIHGCDAYWFDGGVWFGLMDKHGWGLWSYLSRPGPRKVVFGETMRTNAEFQEILRRASADPDFPPKSAMSPVEAAL